MERCKWRNLEKSEIYVDYHDNEWGVSSTDDRYLFEMLVLESFQSGLSWLTILNKRAAFKRAFDSFEVEVVKNYNDQKIEELLENKDIIRNKGKIKATINNAWSFLKVQEEFGSFSNYIWSFTDNKVVFRENDDLVVKNVLSDLVAKDLKKRGFKYMGSITTFSFLEAIGVMNNHFSYCFKSKKKADFNGNL